MKKLNDSIRPSRMPQGARRRFEEPDPQEVQARLKTIDLALRMRFSDYSPELDVLAPLGRSWNFTS